MPLRLFRALMPQSEGFIERFCEHSGLIVPAARAFHALVSEDGAAEAHAAEISRLEEEADAITRATVQAIHRTFITPFDRSQILDLITALDDTIDLMKDTSRRVLRYGVAFTPEMRGMADCAGEHANSWGVEAVGLCSSPTGERVGQWRSLWPDVTTPRVCMLPTSGGERESATATKNEPRMHF